MFYDLGVLSKQQTSDLGIIFRPESFVYFLLTEDEYMFITENSNYFLVV